MLPAGVITIGIPPEIDVGPISLAWHGLTIVLGIAIAAAAAARWARGRGLDPEPMYTLTGLLAISGLVGGRLFYVLEHGGALLGTRGFTFDGGFILAAIVLLIYVRRSNLDVRLLDVIAVWLPLGVAIGRLGDVINGEHHGARSDGLLAVRNSHPDALTPDSRFAYENGGLYEVLLGLVLFAAMWALRNRLTRPGDLAWTVIGLFAIGRFFVFFLRSDSPDLALGLSNAQWTSILLLAVAIAGRAIGVRRSDGTVRRAPPQPRSR